MKDEAISAIGWCWILEGGYVLSVEHGCHNMAKLIGNLPIQAFLYSSTVTSFMI